MYLQGMINLAREISAEPNEALLTIWILFNDSLPIDLEYARLMEQFDFVNERNGRWKATFYDCDGFEYRIELLFEPIGICYAVWINGISANPVPRTRGSLRRLMYELATGRAD